MRRVSVGAIVDMSTHSSPSCAPSTTASPPCSASSPPVPRPARPVPRAARARAAHSSPSSTEATCSPSTTMLTTISLACATSAGVSTAARTVLGGPPRGLARGVRPDGQRKAGAPHVGGHPRTHDAEANESDPLGHTCILLQRASMRALGSALPQRRLARAGAVRARRGAPRPSAVPRQRAVLRIPLSTPTRERAAARMTVALLTGNERPEPGAHEREPNGQAGAGRSPSASTPKPSAASSGPPRVSTRASTCSARRPASAAQIPSATGRMAELQPG